MKLELEELDKELVRQKVHSKDIVVDSRMIYTKPDEVRTTLRDTVGILNCIVEMRESSQFVGDAVSVLTTLGIKGTARVMEQLTQQ